MEDSNAKPEGTRKLSNYDWVWGSDQDQYETNDDKREKSPEGRKEPPAEQSGD